MRFDVRPRPRPRVAPRPPASRPAPAGGRPGRAAAPLASAFALALLAHCSFPEYSFRSVDDDETSGGSGGAAGRGASGGPAQAGSAGRGQAGGPAAGAGGGGGSAGGAGGAPGCTENCEFVVATTSNEVFSVVSDGTTAFWSEFNPQNGECTIFARPADGSGNVRTVSAPNQLPDGDVVVDLEADDDALYGLLLDNSFNGPPHGLVRIPKAGGPAQTLLDSTDRNTFAFEVGDALIYAFRDGDNAPPGEVVRVAKTGGNALLVTNDAFSLLGVENDRALVVDNDGNVVTVRRDSGSEPAQSSVFLPADGNPVPFPFEAVFDADAYYFLAQGSVRRLPRGGAAADLTFLANNAGNDPRFLRADAGALFWVNRRGANGIGDLHTAAKSGATTSDKLVVDIASDGLSVAGGVAYFISNDFTKVVGRRLR